MPLAPAIWATPAAQGATRPAGRESRQPAARAAQRPEHLERRRIERRARQGSARPPVAIGSCTGSRHGNALS
eukprot:3962202-Lingulodinium_polyedra.AAC.1